MKAMKRAKRSEHTTKATKEHKHSLNTTQTNKLTRQKYNLTSQQASKQASSETGISQIQRQFRYKPKETPTQANMVPRKQTVTQTDIHKIFVQLAEIDYYEVAYKPLCTL